MMEYIYIEWCDGEYCYNRPAAGRVGRHQLLLRVTKLCDINSHVVISVKQNLLKNLLKKPGFSIP